jgi:hypothetical protein
MRKRAILAGGTESNSQHSTAQSRASTPPAPVGAIGFVDAAMYDASVGVAVHEQAGDRGE